MKTTSSYYAPVIKVIEVEPKSIMCQSELDPYAEYPDTPGGRD